ncbi:MAG TPA: hypothetical protein VK582_14890, partial [Pyrinomonadaceae bacterium]|nr:hypothetical protein [Pyrinomonadaceae bacterium]
KLKTNSLMSKSIQTKYQPSQAPRRPGRSLDLKPLDFERRFIDDSIMVVVVGSPATLDQSSRPE